MLHISTMKNDSPHATFSVEGGVEEVLPFPTDNAKMFLSHALRVGRLVFRLGMF